MTKEEKIAAIVEANLESMDLKDLERYYIDTQVFEYETYASAAEIDEEYDRVRHSVVFFVNFSCTCISLVFENLSVYVVAF